MTKWSSAARRRPWRRRSVSVGHGGDEPERGGGGGDVQEDEGAHPRHVRWLGAAGDDHSGRIPARTGTASGGHGEGSEDDVDGDDGRATKQGRRGAGRGGGDAGGAPARGDEAAAVPSVDELGADVGGGRGGC